MLLLKPSNKKSKTPVKEPAKRETPTNGKVNGKAAKLPMANLKPKTVKLGAYQKVSARVKTLGTRTKAPFKEPAKRKNILYGAAAVIAVGAILAIAALMSGSGDDEFTKVASSQSENSAGGEKSDTDQLRALLGTGDAGEKSETEQLRALLGTDNADEKSETEQLRGLLGTDTPGDKGSASSAGSGFSPGSALGKSPLASPDTFGGASPSPPGTSSPSPPPVSSGPVPSPSPPPVSSGPVPSPGTPPVSSGPVPSPGGSKTGSAPSKDGGSGAGPGVVIVYGAESDTGSIEQVSAMSGIRTGSAVDVGKDPTDVAFSKGGTKAFIVNRGDDTVSVVRLSNGKIVNTIKVGDGPTSISLSPNGKRLLVSDTSAGTVSLLGPTSGSKGLGSKLATFDVGSSPKGTYIKSKKRAYVALSGSNELAILDLPSRKKIAQVAVGSSPTAVVGKGSKVYVTNSESGTVSIVSTLDKKVIDTVKVGKRPTAAALSKGGSRLYVVNEGSKTISVINTKSKKVISTFRWTKKRMKAVGAGSLKKPSPRGIIYDAGTGAIFVTDIANERLWMINPVKKKILGPPATVKEQPLVARIPKRSKK